MNNPDWISVEDKLPDAHIDDSFVVAKPSMYANGVYSYFVCDWINGEWEEDGVTYWQPIQKISK